MKAEPLKIVHIINSFGHGGAETMLCNLLLHTDPARFTSSVVSLIDDLTVAGPILNAGFMVTTMGMKPNVPDPRGFTRLVRHLRRARPDVVQTWMDHSNLIGGLASHLAYRTPLVWSIHASHAAGRCKRTTRWTISACGSMSSRLPSRVVCCSESSRDYYLRQGFEASNMEVIPNGFDTGRFCPDSAARLSLRSELGLDPDAPLVGLVARYDPLKDHATFLRGAARLSRLVPKVRFVLCGHRIDDENVPLKTMIRELGLAGRCHLLGPRTDVARVQAALDVASLTSISEAFPLVLGEAMACGVPCVATNAGDSAMIIGPHGRVVPQRDPRALADGLFEILTMEPGERRRLGLAARRRVCELFDLGAVTRRYEAIYTCLAARESAGCEALVGPTRSQPEWKGK
ncbi:MAG: glycosyltransferase [Isosphaeraceae bacterium]